MWMLGMFSRVRTFPVKARIIFDSDGLSAAANALKPQDFHVLVKYLPSESDLKPLELPQIKGLRLYEGDEALTLVRKLRTSDCPTEFFRDELGATKCWLILINGKARFCILGMSAGLSKAAVTIGR